MTILLYGRYCSIQYTLKHFKTFISVYRQVFFFGRTNNLLHEGLLILKVIDAVETIFGRFKTQLIFNTTNQSYAGRGSNSYNNNSR